MAQTLKTEIKDRINNAAFQVFFRKDYRSAKMSEIANEASISVGNIYRYYKNKENLFYRIIPPEQVSNIKKMLTKRIQAAYGINDLKKLDQEAQYWKIFEEQLKFILEHRQMIVILLCNSRGTIYENFKDELINLMKTLTRKYLKSIGASEKRTPETDFTMDLIYNHLIDVIVNTLSKFEDRKKANLIIRKFLSYHLAGLKAFHGL
jgi:AcrR family transcriptional regulator